MSNEIDEEEEGMPDLGFAVPREERNASLWAGWQPTPLTKTWPKTAWVSPKPEPRQPMSEVLPGLFIGNLDDAKVARDFDLTVNVSGVPTPVAAHGHMHVDWPLNDNGIIPDEDKLWGLARLIASVMRNDPEALVFVHCAMGWNRSGIVMACAVMLIKGVDGHKAVEILREARGENALCNRVFEDYVRSHNRRTNKASQKHRRAANAKRNGGGPGWKGVWR